MGHGRSDDAAMPAAAMRVSAACGRKDDCARYEQRGTKLNFAMLGHPRLPTRASIGDLEQNFLGRPIPLRSIVAARPSAFRKVRLLARLRPRRICGRPIWQAIVEFLGVAPAIEKSNCSKLFWLFEAASDRAGSPPQRAPARPLQAPSTSAPARQDGAARACAPPLRACRRP